MGSYLYDKFLNNIDKKQIKTIFELGSRDLLDAQKLYEHYKCPVYSFECNPDCLIECKNNYSNFDEITRQNIYLIEKAVSLDTQKVSFFPFDLTKFDNKGASSMFKIDFTKRDLSDPDYNRENPQKEITVDGIRIDEFLLANNIQNIDLLCMDLQGYELNAIKSIGNHIQNVKYIITECSISSTYENGATFIELINYLNKYNFSYCCSNKFDGFPNLNLTGFSEFDSLFINNSIV